MKRKPRKPNSSLKRIPLYKLVQRLSDMATAEQKSFINQLTCVGHPDAEHLRITYNVE